LGKEDVKRMLNVFEVVYLVGGVVNWRGIGDNKEEGRIKRKVRKRVKGFILNIRYKVLYC
jgi:hypothetical protein